MKTLLHCYVYDSPDQTDQTVLQVKPVVVFNRRHNILNDKYRTVKDIQSYYGNVAILRKPRKLSRKRNVLELTTADEDQDTSTEKRSRNSKLWKTLSEPICGDPSATEETQPVLRLQDCADKGAVKPVKLDKVAAKVAAARAAVELANANRLSVQSTV